MDYGFLVVWRFGVRSGMEPTFETIYGAQGDWVTLFKTGEGFIRTELNRSATDPRVYLTLDYWTSEEAYDHFREQHAVEYKTLDAKCEALTEEEIEVGKFKKAT